MVDRKQRRTTWMVIASALILVTAGIVYLNQAAGQADAFAVNDGYDQYRDSLANAKAAFDAGEALFVDVRTEREYNASHIPGAVSIPLGNIAGNEPAVEKEVLIYTYCT